ncbi:MFS transporter [Helicobacter anatolicus]|uniref:MFS transporter n=1 Tax=Helicobacter anatolicus TaxID=2905874 RepID=UPI001E4710AB|nr:MFS transporter [Helicobacter anatolicus]
MQETTSNYFQRKISSLVQRRLFKFSLFSTTATTILGGIIIAPSLPQLQNHFISVPHIEFLSRLVVTFPALFVVIFAPISGILLDKYKKVKILIFCMLLWAISGASGFFLNDIYLILFSRAFFGIATAFIMTGATSLIAEYYVGNERQKALSLQGFATACGSAIFISIGGFLANLDWRYPFLVYLLGIPLAFLAGLMLFEPRVPKIATKKYSDYNHQEKTPVFKLIFVYLMAFLGFVVYYISPTQIPFFITHNLHKSSDLIGISMSASAIAYGFSSLSYSFFRSYFKISQLYGLACFLMGMCFLLLYIFHSYAILFVALVFLGMGGGILFVNNNSFLLSFVPASSRAKALGGLSSIVFLGQFLSPVFSQIIVQSFGIITLFLCVFILLFILGVLFWGFYFSPKGRRG